MSGEPLTAEEIAELRKHIAFFRSEFGSEDMKFDFSFILRALDTLDDERAAAADLAVRLEAAEQDVDHWHDKANRANDYREDAIRRWEEHTGLNGYDLARHEPIKAHHAFGSFWQRFFHEPPRFFVYLFGYSAYWKWRAARIEQSRDDLRAQLAALAARAVQGPPEQWEPGQEAGRRILDASRRFPSMRSLIFAACAGCGKDWTQPVAVQREGRSNVLGD